MTNYIYLSFFNPKTFTQEKLSRNKKKQPFNKESQWVFYIYFLCI